jgi:5-carboxymethyl-2-hydroxymuconate isomerase
MPHIVIEYSEVLQPFAKSVLRAVHQEVTDSGLFDAQAVKGRAMAYDVVQLPEGACNFMHITVSILSGRTQEERTQLANSVFVAARAMTSEIDRLSVNIHEMEKTTYRK